jgi:hypothetical protein
MDVGNVAIVSSVTAFAPPEPLDRRRLWSGVFATGLFLISVSIQGALRPGYDAWQQAVSALSLGPGGWVQDVSFAMFGVAILVTVPAWRRVLSRGPGARAYPILMALTGLSLVAVSAVPQDPAPGYDPEQLGHQLPTLTGLIHLALAAVMASATSAAMFVMASRFAAMPDWRGWAWYTRAAASLTIACVIVYAVWSTRATGLAGAFERMVIVIPGVWGYFVVRRLTHRAELTIS